MHINSIGAGMYSDLSVVNEVFDPVGFTWSETAFKGFFDLDTKFTRVRNVREFPAMGTPPNVVNVPTYGQSTSQQIQGQADAPSMEISLNFVASDWAAGTVLGDKVGDGKQYIFRFTLLNSQPANFTGGATGGLKDVQNTQYFWVGKIEALQVTPQLTDANTATLTVTIQSEFFGAYTDSA